MVVPTMWQLLVVPTSMTTIDNAFSFTVFECSNEPGDIKMLKASRPFLSNQLKNKNPVFYHI